MRFGLDWGKGKKLVSSDGHVEEEHPEGLKAFFEAHPGSTVIMETAFESYLGTGERDEVVRLARQLGINFLLVNPRHTKNVRWRKELVKSDTTDARVLYWVGIKDKYQPAKARLFSETPGIDRTNVTRQIVAARREGYKNPASLDALALLPPPADVPRRIAESIVTGIKKKKYHPLHLVISFTFAAVETLANGGNRRDFERMIGLNGHGYPNLIRSNSHHHRYRKDNLFTARWIFQQVKRGAALHYAETAMLDDRPEVFA